MWRVQWGIDVPFPAAVPGHVQDLLVQGPHCTGLSRNLHPQVQDLVRHALLNQSPRQPAGGRADSAWAGIC